MLEKIKNLQNLEYVRQLRDVRVVGFLIFGILVLLVSWSGVGVIESNYTLQKQVTQLQQQNQVSELLNNNQKLQNQYYQTDEYLELMARKQYGKAMPGETLLLVPKDVAMAHTVSEDVKAQAPKPAIQQPAYQRNLEAWRNFFTHRPITGG